MNEKVQAVLLQIHKRDAGLTPGAVVKAARPASSPLHTHFEWDDAVAGEKFRLDQARQLIRCVVIEVGSDEEPRSVRAWVNVRPTEEGDQRYVPEDEARVNPVARELVLSQMRSDIASLTRRYRYLNEYWDAMREAIGELA